MTNNTAMNKKSVRVLHVIGGMNTGGAETMIMHLYRKIDRKAIQFDFISFTKEKCHYDDEIEALGGRVFYVAPPKTSNAAKFVLDLYRVIKQYGPYHAVHAHTLYNSGLALLAARIAGVKMRLCHSHTTSSQYGKVSYIKKCYFFIMKMLIRLSSNKYLSCTNAAGEFLFGKKVNKNKNFNVLYNAINLNPYNFIDVNTVENKRMELGIEKDTVVIGHVGNFGEHKNHSFLIKLAEFFIEKKIKFRLLLIGEGSIKWKIEKDVKEKGLEKEVTFLGYQANIPIFMNLFDVFVFPSLFEGLGIVLIEAQAAGTPCVISNNIPDECDMGIGLIKRIDLGDSLDKWFEVIVSCCRCKKLSLDKTINSIIEKGYNLDNSVKKLLNIYEIA